MPPRSPELAALPRTPRKRLLQIREQHFRVQAAVRENHRLQIALQKSWARREVSLM